MRGPEVSMLARELESREWLRSIGTILFLLPWRITGGGGGRRGGLYGLSFIVHSTQDTTSNNTE